MVVIALPPSRYALFSLCLLVVLGNTVSVHAQAISLCEISYLRFYYPQPVQANQPFTVTTTVALFSCDAGPVRARVDLFDFHHDLISSGSSWVYSPIVNVTNTITAPRTNSPNIVYATAYMVLFDGQIVGSYMSWFQLSVVPSTEITTTTSVVQISSQTTASLSTMTSSSTLTSTESTPTTSAATISSQNVSALVLSSDLPYELVILFAVLFIVALAVLDVRRRKRK